MDIKYTLVYIEETKNWRIVDSKDDCNCGSLIQHWKKFTEKNWPPKCSIGGCKNAAEMCVKMINSSDKLKEEFVVPICQECFDSHKDIVILELKTTICSSNKNKTCERLKELL